MTTSISPELSLDLRLRFLETLLASKQSESNITTNTTITRKLDLIESELKILLNDPTSTEALRRFVLNYDLNEPLLRLPPLAPSSTHSSDSTSLNVLEKVALVLESDNEIRGVEKDLREIERLDERGVVGAGKLGDHEELKEELKRLTFESTPLNSNYAELETRTETLLCNYNEYINTVSEIFLSWNDIITSAEDEVARREKVRDHVEDIS